MQLPLIGSLSVVILTFMFGCDSTIAINKTRPGINGVKVIGVCPEPGNENLSFVNLSVQIEDDLDSLAGPDFVLLEQEETLQEHISVGRFSFVLNANADGQQSDTATPGASAQGETTGALETIAFAANRIEFRAPGYPPVDRTQPLDLNQRAAIDARSKLVVFAMDNSASLIGVDGRPGADSPTSGDFLEGAASDRGDNRQLFFDSILRLLDRDDFVSLVKIANDGSANIVECDDSCKPGDIHLCSTPTRDREGVKCGIESIVRAGSEDGTTPLNRVLKDIYNNIIRPNADLNPVVVLFTDGSEEDETISALRGADGALELYANGYQNNELQAPVPVIVLHLDQTALAGTSQMNGGFGFRRGRDERLMELACSTGGEYLFLENASKMTDLISLGELSKVVRNRIEGTWSLRTETGLGELPVDSWFVSTTMRANLADKEINFAMQQRGGDNADPKNDSRLWLFRD